MTARTPRIETSDPTAPTPADGDGAEATVVAPGTSGLMWRNATAMPGDLSQIPRSLDGRPWKIIGITDLTDVCGHLAVEILATTGSPDHRISGRQRGHVDPDAPAVAPLSPRSRTDHHRGASRCREAAAPSQRRGSAASAPKAHS